VETGIRGVETRATGYSRRNSQFGIWSLRLVVVANGSLSDSDLVPASSGFHRSLAGKQPLLKAAQAGLVEPFALVML